MKIKKEARIQIRIDKDLKGKAEKKIADIYKKSISEYLREKLEEVVKTDD